MSRNTALFLLLCRLGITVSTTSYWQEQCCSYRVLFKCQLINPPQTTPSQDEHEMRYFSSYFRSVETQRVYLLGTELTQATEKHVKLLFCKDLCQQPHGLAHNPYNSHGVALCWLTAMSHGF